MSADMSKAPTREAGWYWTRSQYGLWEPNKWHPQGEWETENQYGKREGEPHEIGPRILDPEAAASEQAELLAALRRHAIYSTAGASPGSFFAGCRECGCEWGKPFPRQSEEHHASECILARAALAKAEERR